jgi:hypothetical protein
VTELSPRRCGAVLFAIFVLGACSKDSDTPGILSRVTRGKTDDSAAGTVDLGGGSYKPGPLTAVGTVAGKITLTGAVPADTARITVDTTVCGTKMPAVVDTAKGGLGDVVVWIADISTGKRLPTEKRAELSHDGCELDPRVQAVVVGTTVNVFNDDKLIHKLAFTRLGTTDTLTKMPFFNSGEVVASERLAKEPGIVEVRCAQHPWTRAYLVVFDHPYFAVTDADGSFKIDSLPPGTYTVNAWHEGMTQPATHTVTVAANGTASVDLGVALK